MLTKPTRSYQNLHLKVNYIFYAKKNGKVDLIEDLCKTQFFKNKMGAKYMVKDSFKTNV